MSESERQRFRSDLVDLSDHPPAWPLDASTLVVVYPALAAMSGASRDIYLQFRERYRAEGPSAELTRNALAAAGDLGLLLQSLRRVEGAMTDIRHKRPDLTVPYPILDQIHAGLVLLTGDDPRTLDIAIGSEELTAIFTFGVTDHWLSEVERWLAGLQGRGAI